MKALCLPCSYALLKESPFGCWQEDSVSARQKKSLVRAAFHWGAAATAFRFDFWRATPLTPSTSASFCTCMLELTRNATSTWKWRCDPKGYGYCLAQGQQLGTLPGFVLMQNMKISKRLGVYSLGPTFSTSYHTFWGPSCCRRDEEWTPLSIEELWTPRCLHPQWLNS